jgi:hypothetical protein
MTAARPGPPPLPPEDLHRRKLPIATLAAGTVLWRIHRTALGPLYFGRSDDPVRRQRWDSPDADYGVCYLATESHVGFVETFLKDLSLDFVSEQEIATRSLAEVEVRRAIRLAQVDGEGLRPLGATATVPQATYDVTWSWSAALHAHPDQMDGIRYRANHDDSGFAIALFDRAADAIAVRSTSPLSNIPDHLGAWLDRYRVGLTP